jgi:hypothetical protein
LTSLPNQRNSVIQSGQIESANFGDPFDGCVGFGPQFVKINRKMEVLCELFVTRLHQLTNNCHNIAARPPRSAIGRLRVLPRANHIFHGSLDRQEDRRIPSLIPPRDRQLIDQHAHGWVFTTDRDGSLIRGFVSRKMMPLSQVLDALLPRAQVTPVILSFVKTPQTLLT